MIKPVSELSGRFLSGARGRILRATGKLSAARGLPIPVGFFDEYTRFYSTSVTGHDGRWSFAAIKVGAAKAVGIEARDHLVQAAEANLREYKIPEERFSFILGDVFEQLDRIEPGRIDTVFCFGFFYHVADHMLLAAKIAELKPHHLIPDTVINFDPRCVILLKTEDSDHESNASRFGPNAARTVLTGTSSRPALELMLSSFGWSFIYYDWRHAGILGGMAWKTTTKAGVLRCALIARTRRCAASCQTVRRSTHRFNLVKNSTR
jgi:hypothetical protein